jgi:hypothetical protein
MSAALLIAGAIEVVTLLTCLLACYANGMVDAGGQTTCGRGCWSRPRTSSLNVSW